MVLRLDILGVLCSGNHKGITHLTALSLETTISLTEDERETKLMIKRPPSESNSFALWRKGSSTKFSGGQDSPELWEQPFASSQSPLRINRLVKEWQYDGRGRHEKSQYLRSDESTSMTRILIALLALPFDAEWFAAMLSSTYLIPSPKCT